MTDLEKQIQEYVEKGLSGDMASVNSIEDRILRGKVKAAIVKAKRLGVKKESSQLEKTDAKSSNDDGKLVAYLGLQDILQFQRFFYNNCSILDWSFLV